MEPIWGRSATNNGIPYFINHSTERTQWDHPDLVKAMDSLEELGNIRFSAYRTAMKLRTLQKLLRLDYINMRMIQLAFDQYGFKLVNNTVMDVVQLYNIIYDIYTMCHERGHPDVDVHHCSDLLLNWILNLYDRGRTGCLRVISVKIGIVTLCAARITEKYRYFYEQISDRTGCISRRSLAILLQDMIEVTNVIVESEAFGRSVTAAVESCFGSNFGTTVENHQFMSWMLAEPQTIVWLPTLHRLAASETIKHESKCCICKAYPIIGLRYKCLKCLNFDLCQDCFFTGRTTKMHKYTHPTQEYCLAASTKDDARAFGKIVRNKLNKKRGRAIKQKYLPISGGTEPDFAVSHGKPVSDTHFRLNRLSHRLAEVETMSPPRPVGQLNVATSTQLKSDSTKLANQDDHFTERQELQQMVDILQKENEELIRQFDEQCSIGSVESDSHSEYEWLKLQREEMLARQEILQEQNKQLELQLRRLRLMTQDHQTSSPHHPIGNPLVTPNKAPHSSMIDRTAPPRLLSYQSSPEIDRIDIGKSLAAARASSSFQPSPQTQIAHTATKPSKLLPPHLIDQSSLRFPSANATRFFPSEEAELQDLIRKLDDVFPMNATYETSQHASYQVNSDISGLHQELLGDRSEMNEMLSAATRVGNAMSSLVSKVAVNDDGMVPYR